MAAIVQKNAKTGAVRYSTDGGKTWTMTTDTTGDTAADAAVGAGTGASFDFDDEIAGVIGKIQGKDYHQSRDEYRARKELASSRSPVANGAGQVAGMVGSTLATGGVGAEAGAAATGARAALKAGGRLFAEGAVQGAGGASELDDIPEDAVEGGAAALATGGAIKGAGKLLGKAAPRFARAADRQLVAAVGVNPAKARETPGGVEKLAGYLRQEKLGRPFQSAASMQERAEASGNAIKGRRDAIASDMDAKGVMASGRRIASDLDAHSASLGGPEIQIKAKPARPANAAGDATVVDNPRAAVADRVIKDPSNQGQRRHLDQLAKYNQERGVRPFGEVNNARAKAMEAVKYENAPGAGAADRVQRKVAGIYNDELEHAANLHDPGVGSEFRALGQEQARAIRVNDALLARLDKGSFENPANPLRFAGKVSALAGQAHAFGALGASGAAKGSAALSKAARIAANPAGRAVADAATGDEEHPKAQEGAQRVASAAPEDQAQAHFLESFSNPQYRASVMEDKEDLEDRQ